MEKLQDSISASVNIKNKNMGPNPVNAIILPLLLSCLPISALNKDQDKENPQVNFQGDSENPFPTVGAIPPPIGYVRLPMPKKSFEEWLRNRPLKKDKTVYLFNGRPKADQSAQFAVLDISVGSKDMQQCADAVIRLRAEFLYSQGRFSEILFRDNNGKAYSYGRGFNRAEFDHYLDNVFIYCGTISLAKQLHSVPSYREVRIGDVLIQGGSPGHAMQIMDMAVDPSGNKVFLLSQSYMPAQSIHLVINPSQLAISPWYTLDSAPLRTPGWTFSSGKCRRW
jgi:hypothetical protein